MPNYTVPANAEGLPAINRRRLLGGIAAVSTASAVAGASAAAASAVTPSEPEHPWDKARRLADELAEVLAEGDGSTGPGGEWYAMVHPLGTAQYPVCFGNMRSRDWAERNVSLPMRKVIEAHKEARTVFEASCTETDVGPGKKPSKAAQRRYKRANKAELAALTAVCAFSPLGRADAKAKAQYLLPFCQYGELQDFQVEALITSAVRS